MALAAEGHDRAALRNTNITDARSRGKVSRICLAVSSLALMAVAANCFLEYLWWTAKHSALTGVPKLAEQWNIAGTRESLYGWSFLVLDLAALFIIYGLIPIRAADLFRKALRLVTSVVITLVATGLFALALAWIKESH